MSRPYFLSIFSHKKKTGNAMLSVLIESSYITIA